MSKSSKFPKSIVLGETDFPLGKIDGFDLHINNERRKQAGRLPDKRTGDELARDSYLGSDLTARMWVAAHDELGSDYGPSNASQDNRDARWYRDQIRHFQQSQQTAIEENDVASIAQASAAIGCIFGEARTAGVYKEHAIRGQKTLDSARQGGKQSDSYKSGKTRKKHLPELVVATVEALKKQGYNPSKNSVAKHLVDNDKQAIKWRQEHLVACSQPHALQGMSASETARKITVDDLE